jgi:hypothetical protein
MKKFKGVVDGKLEFISEGIHIRISPTYRQTCLSCGRWQYLELRQTADGIVRDQPYCSQCRTSEATAIRKANK